MLRKGIRELSPMKPTNKGISGSMLGVYQGKEKKNRKRGNGRGDRKTGTD